MKQRRDNFSPAAVPRAAFPMRPGSASVAYTPLAETDIVFYWDPDAVGTGTLSAITDQSTGGHNLSQGTAARRAVNTAAQFGTHRGLVFPAAANHGGYIFDAEWNKPVNGTIYCLVKYVEGAGAQALYNGDISGTYGVICEIGPTTSDTGSIITGSNSVQTSAMANGSTHLLKFGWVTGANIYVSIDGGAYSSAVWDAAHAGSFAEIGLSSLAAKDLISVLGVQAIRSTFVDGDAEDVRITDYLKAWAGIA